MEKNKQSNTSYPQSRILTPSIIDHSQQFECFDNYLQGWEQAEYAAQRLKALAVPYTRIVQSSMTRAKNTASIISKHLPDVPVDTCDFLREGAPIKPVPESPHWKPDAQVSLSG